MLKSKINILEYQNNNILPDKDGFIVDKILNIKLHIDNNTYTLNDVTKMYIQSNVITIENNIPLFNIYNLYAECKNNELLKIDKVDVEGTCINIYEPENILHFTTSFEDAYVYDIIFNNFVANRGMVIKLRGITNDN